MNSNYQQMLEKNCTEFAKANHVDANAIIALVRKSHDEEANRISSEVEKLNKEKMEHIARISEIETEVKNLLATRDDIFSCEIREVKTTQEPTKVKQSKKTSTKHTKTQYPIYAFNPATGELLHTFNSYSEIEAAGIHYGTVYNILAGKCKSTNGMTFSLSPTFEGEKFEPRQRGKNKKAANVNQSKKTIKSVRHSKHTKRVSPKQVRPVYVYNLQSRELVNTFNSQKETLRAMSQNNKSRYQSILNCLNERQGSAFGMVFSYVKLSDAELYDRYQRSQNPKFLRMKKNGK